jgi:hypothetical protein
LDLYTIKEKMYHDNLDFSGLKDGVDKDKLIKLAYATIKQVSFEYGELENGNWANVDIDKLIEKLEEYMEFIRSGYYK